LGADGLGNAESGLEFPTYLFGETKMLSGRSWGPLLWTLARRWRASQEQFEEILNKIGFLSAATSCQYSLY
jgi:hypothetical protein